MPKFLLYRITSRCIKVRQAARVVQTDKNVPIKLGSKMETNTWKRKVPHLRSSLSGGPAAPPVPQLQGRALQQEWLWPKPTASSSSRSFPQGHKPLPQRAPVVCVSTRLSRPSPCPLLWARQPPGVIKRRDPSQREAFPPIFLLPSSVWWGASEKVSGGFPRLPSSFLQRTPSFGKK